MSNIDGKVFIEGLELNLRKNESILLCRTEHLFSLAILTLRIEGSVPLYFLTYFSEDGRNKRELPLEIEVFSSMTLLEGRLVHIIDAWQPSQNQRDEDTFPKANQMTSKQQSALTRDERKKMEKVATKVKISDVYDEWKKRRRQN